MPSSSILYSTMCSAQTLHPEDGCLCICPCCTSPRVPWWAADILLASPCRRAALHPSAAESAEGYFSMLSPMWGLCSCLCACSGRDNSPAAAPGSAQLRGQSWQARTELAGRLCCSLSSVNTAPQGKAGCPLGRTSGPEGNASKLSIPVIWY